MCIKLIPYYLINFETRNFVTKCFICTAPFWCIFSSYLHLGLISASETLCYTFIKCSFKGSTFTATIAIAIANAKGSTFTAANANAITNAKGSTFTATIANGLSIPNGKNNTIGNGNGKGTTS